MDRVLSARRTFHDRHERLKNYVHTAWRYPLPKWGRVTMGFVYFCIPVIGGYAISQWTLKKSNESIGENGEKLRVKEITGLGDKRIVDGEVAKVGAGGIGGGVRLAVSDSKTQEQNNKMLMAFLKQQKRKNRENQSEPE